MHFLKVTNIMSSKSNELRKLQVHEVKTEVAQTRFSKM